jgi:hypothetical protein
MHDDRESQLKRTFEVLKSFELDAIRIREGQKAPTSDWDPRKKNDRNKVIDNLGNDNIAVHLHGRLVDVDVDTFDGQIVEALDLCLPKSSLTWGRKSKPRSHRLFFLDSEFDREPFARLLRVTKGLEVEGTSLSVEVRGGGRSSGFVSVMPGSVHPEGEMYTWDSLDTSVSPANVRAVDLIDALRMAAAGALMSRYWVSGIRNDMSLALSGALWRMHSLAVSAAEASDTECPNSAESLAKAERLLRTIMTLAQDDSSDIDTRLANLRNTWRKMDRDPNSKMVGATRLAELIGNQGQQVIRKLYALMADDSGALEFEELAERFRIWYGQGVLIDLDMVERGLPQFWMTKDQTKNSMGGRFLMLSGKKIPVASILFSSLAVGRVYGVTFDPSTTDIVVEQDEVSMVNQWRGFKVKPADDVTEEEIQPFIDYVRNIVAAGDEKAGDWVLDWCADILQEPHNKPGTSLVLVGIQGAGKTFLGECVMGAIIGATHYGQTNSISSLTERFNQIVDNKLLLQCDEAIHSYQRDIAARLKALVTDQTLRIEPKFVNPYMKPNHMRFIFTSNEETGALFIDATPAERRFTVLKVDGCKAGDQDYWRGLREWVSDNLDKIAGYLNTRAYTKASVRRPYLTNAKRMLQGVGVPLEVSWIHDRIQGGFPLAPVNHKHWWQAFVLAHEEVYSRSNQLLADHWPNMVSLSALEDDYKSYIRERGKPIHTGNVWFTIKCVFPDASIEPAQQRTVVVVDSKTGDIHKRRVRLYTFPSSTDIIRHLESKYGEVFGDIVAPASAKTINSEIAEY